MTAARFRRIQSDSLSMPDNSQNLSRFGLPSALMEGSDCLVSIFFNICLITERLAVYYSSGGSGTALNDVVHLTHPIIQNVGMFCVDVDLVCISQRDIQNFDRFPQIVDVLERVVGFSLATLELAVHDTEATWVLHSFVVEIPFAIDVYWLSSFGGYPSDGGKFIAAVWSYDEFGLGTMAD